MGAIKVLLWGFVGFVIVYLEGAFLQASFDISTWSEKARGIVGIFGFIAFFVAVAIAESGNDDDDEIDNLYDYPNW